MASLRMDQVLNLTHKNKALVSFSQLLLHGCVLRVRTTPFVSFNDKSNYSLCLLNLSKTSKNGCNFDITTVSTKKKYTFKALANKNAILVFAFQTPKHFTHFG